MKEYKAEIIRFKNHYIDWITFIGYDESNKPSLIFTGRSSSFYLPDWVTDGTIEEVQEPGILFNFVFIDKDGYKITLEKINKIGGSFDEKQRILSKHFSNLISSTDRDKTLEMFVYFIDEILKDKHRTDTDVWLSAMIHTLKYLLKI